MRLITTTLAAGVLLAAGASALASTRTYVCTQRDGWWAFPASTPRNTLLCH